MTSTNDAEHIHATTISRRTFVKAVAAAGTGFAIFTRLPGGQLQALAAIPGGTLEPADVTKYATPMLIPPAMPRAGKVKRRMAKNVGYYEIAMRQFDQQILPAGHPKTTVWGYGPNPATVQGGPVIFNAPSLTIEAKHNKPVRIKWINELVAGSGDYLPHLLPVDQTLHWAHPPGGTSGRDKRPDFTGQPTPGSYAGPVPIVTPVHGAATRGPTRPSSSAGTGSASSTAASRGS